MKNITSLPNLEKVFLGDLTSFFLEQHSRANRYVRLPGAKLSAVARSSTGYHLEALPNVFFHTVDRDGQSVVFLARFELDAANVRHSDKVSYQGVFNAAQQLYRSLLAWFDKHGYIADDLRLHALPPSCPEEYKELEQAIEYEFCDQIAGYYERRVGKFHAGTGQFSICNDDIHGPMFSTSIGGVFTLNGVSDPDQEAITHITGTLKMADVFYNFSVSNDTPDCVAHLLVSLDSLRSVIEQQAREFCDTFGVFRVRAEGVDDTRDGRDFDIKVTLKSRSTELSWEESLDEPVQI